MSPAEALIATPGLRVPSREEYQARLEGMLAGPGAQLVLLSLRLPGGTGNPSVDTLCALALVLVTAIRLHDEIARLTAALDRVTEELAEARARAEPAVAL